VFSVVSEKIRAKYWCGRRELNYFVTLKRATDFALGHNPASLVG
jgi:hypothetical protein